MEGLFGLGYNADRESVVWIMATFNLRKFTNPDWLGTISVPRLVRLLSPWHDYLASRGFDLQSESGVAVDCGALAQVLMTPDSSTPVEMIEALYYIQETSSPEDMESLRARAAARRLLITDDLEVTPTDYVIDAWLADPAIVHECHAEAIARRQQNFEYFLGRLGHGRTFPAIEPDVRLQMQSALDDWFSDHKRGRGCRLFVFPHPPIIWLLVRHGLPMRREASHRDDGTAGTAFYRPQQHDVITYDENTDEIGIHAGIVGERKLYLRTIGGILFGDEGYFPQTPKFTLEPLVEQGAAALNCADIDGMDDVKLVEYHQYWGGAHKESEVRRATDIFAAMEKRGSGNFLTRTPTAATFKVIFSGSPKERRVVIRTPASARYERNEDCEIVERWLRERGFLLRRAEVEDDDDADLTAVLEGP